MIAKEMVEFDYKAQIRPLLADCFYYYGLNSLPELLSYASDSFNTAGFGPRVTEQEIESSPSEMPCQFLQAATLYHKHLGITCEDELPSQESLHDRITQRVDELVEYHFGKIDEGTLYRYVLKDVCAAYKSTGVTSGHIRIVLEWNLDETIDSLVAVRKDLEANGYTPPKRIAIT